MASLSEAWSAAGPDRTRSEGFALPRPPAPLKSRKSAPLHRLATVLSGTFSNFRRQPEKDATRKRFIDNMLSAGWEAGLAEWFWSASEEGAAAREGACCVALTEQTGSQSGGRARYLRSPRPGS